MADSMLHGFKLGPATALLQHSSSTAGNSSSANAAGMVATAAATTSTGATGGSGGVSVGITSGLNSGGGTSQSAYIDRQYRFSSDYLYRLGFLGLKVLLICFPRHAMQRNRLIASIITDLGLRQCGGIHTWKFLDFLVTHRPSLYILLMPFIRFKISQVRCESQGERAFQQIITQKLVGLYLPSARSGVSKLKELAASLRAIREEMQGGTISTVHQINIRASAMAAAAPPTHPTGGGVASTGAAGNGAAGDDATLQQQQQSHPEHQLGKIHSGSSASIKFKGGRLSAGNGSLRFVHPSQTFAGGVAMTSHANPQNQSSVKRNTREMDGNSLSIGEEDEAEHEDQVHTPTRAAGSGTGGVLASLTSDSLNNSSETNSLMQPPVAGASGDAIGDASGGALGGALDGASPNKHTHIAKTTTPKRTLSGKNAGLGTKSQTGAAGVAGVGGGGNKSAALISNQTIGAGTNPGTLAARNAISRNSTKRISAREGQRIINLYSKHAHPNRSELILSGELAVEQPSGERRVGERRVGEAAGHNTDQERAREEAAAPHNSPQTLYFQVPPLICPSYSSGSSSTVSFESASSRLRRQPGTRRRMFSVDYISRSSARPRIQSLTTPSPTASLSISHTLAHTHAHTRCDTFEKTLRRMTIPAEPISRDEQISSVDSLNAQMALEENYLHNQDAAYLAGGGGANGGYSRSNRKTMKLRRNRGSLLRSRPSSQSTKQNVSSGVSAVANARRDDATAGSGGAGGGGSGVPHAKHFQQKSKFKPIGEFSAAAGMSTRSAAFNSFSTKSKSLKTGKEGSSTNYDNQKAAGSQIHPVSSLTAAATAAQLYGSEAPYLRDSQIRSRPEELIEMTRILASAPPDVAASASSSNSGTANPINQPIRSSDAKYSHNNQDNNNKKSGCNDDADNSASVNRNSHSHTNSNVLDGVADEALIQGCGANVLLAECEETDSLCNSQQHLEPSRF